jgi:putative ABC transport system permease protein
MLLQIAWRNLLRNKRRSIILIGAILCGLWGGLVASAVSFGFSYETVRSALETRYSHIQIHDSLYLEAPVLKDTLPGGERLLQSVREIPEVKGASGRALAEGMASTAETATGVEIVGIDAPSEEGVTTIAGHLLSGSYALRAAKNGAVIGAELADKLQAHVGSKVILTMQDLHGDIVGASYHVEGIYRTDSKPYDGITVFVDRRELARLLGLGSAIHEIAIVLKDPEHLESAASRIRAIAPHRAVQTWRERAPELRYINEYTAVYLNIFLYVIVLALLFGITNTMLMSVLDRVREFGVLSAIGMRGRKIFVMIMLESLVLALLGGMGGMAAGWITVAELERTGIDLRAFGEGLRQWGYSEISYPVLPLSMYEQVIVSIVLAAILGAIYPAWKAIRLDAAKAIRTY